MASQCFVLANFAWQKYFMNNYKILPWYIKLFIKLFLKIQMDFVLPHLFKYISCSMNNLLFLEVTFPLTDIQLPRFLMSTLVVLMFSRKCTQTFLFYLQLILLQFAFITLHVLNDNQLMQPSKMLQSHHLLDKYLLNC